MHAFRTWASKYEYDTARLEMHTPSSLSRTPSMMQRGGPSDPGIHSAASQEPPGRETATRSERSRGLSWHSRRCTDAGGTA